jgi:hypothetical protein
MRTFDVEKYVHAPLVCNDFFFVQNFQIEGIFLGEKKKKT